MHCILHLKVSAEKHIARALRSFCARRFDPDSLRLPCGRGNNVLGSVEKNTDLKETNGVSFIAIAITDGFRPDSSLVSM